MGIAAVIQHYYPTWNPPANTGRVWVKCLCPFHDESNPSATVSYEHDAFNCFGCGVKGDAIKIIRYKEGCSYREAVAIAARISPGSYDEVPRSATGERGRRVFGQSSGAASGLGNTGDKQIPLGVRGRPSYWS